MLVAIARVWIWENVRHISGFRFHVFKLILLSTFKYRPIPISLFHFMNVTFHMCLSIVAGLTASASITTTLLSPPSPSPPGKKWVTVYASMTHDP